MEIFVLKIKLEVVKVVCISEDIELVYKKLKELLFEEGDFILEVWKNGELNNYFSDYRVSEFIVNKLNSL